MSASPGRLRAVAAGFEGLSLVLHSAMACEPAQSVERVLTPGQVLQADVAQTGSTLLLEEFGADAEYRRHDDEAFVAIDTLPGRLGLTVLTSRSRACRCE